MAETQAVNQDDLQPTPGEASEELVAVDEDVEGGEDNPGGDGSPDPEVEVVLDGEDAPQSDDVPVGKFLKRVNKLNGKVADAKGEAEKYRSELEEQREANRILRMSLDAQITGQPKEPLKQPDPDSFDGGMYDPDFVRQTQEYQKTLIDAAIEKRLAEATQANQQTAQKAKVSSDFEAKQKEHIKRAEKLKVKNYEESEDKAIEILGPEIVEQIILNVDNSEVLMNYLGKNEAKAESLVHQIKANPVKGLFAIGRLADRIKVKPINETSPDPDVELQGGKPPANSADFRKLDKLREGGNMAEILAHKKKMREKGITFKE